MFAAIRLSELNPEIKICIVEKADIRRSGCLAAGVNALNAYIGKNHTPEDYVNYALNDAHGIASRKLLLTMAQRLNHVTKEIERLGLVIEKDSAGNYVERGWRNVKINGENIKIILADAAQSFPNVKIFNHVNITDFFRDGEKILGAYGFSTREKIFYGFTNYADCDGRSERNLFAESCWRLSSSNLVSAVQYRCGICNGNPRRCRNDDF